MAKRLPKPLGLKPSREDFSSESVVCPVADCGGRMRRGALICGLITYNGWPAGVIDMTGWIIAAGEAANEEAFRAALAKELA